VSSAVVREQSRRPSAWGWLVTVSACLVLGSLATLMVWWFVSREERITTYAVRGAVNGVVLDLGAADAEIAGGDEDDPVRVQRTERFSFERTPLLRRVAEAGRLRIRQRCPRTLLGSCSAAYRVEIPANVPLTVRTTSGDVRFRGFRGSASVDTVAGDIGIADYCGFSLRARTASGDVRAVTSCAVERLELRSRSGAVRAVVPPGRYRVDATTDAGRRRVRGLTPADDAPFVVQALSSTGDVSVEAGS
jgi:Putative adhesin